MSREAAEGESPPLAACCALLLAALVQRGVSTLESLRWRGGNELKTYHLVCVFGGVFACIVYCVFSSFSLTRLSPFFSNSSLEFRGMFSGVSGGNLAVGSASAQVWQSHRFAHCAFHWARSLGSPLEPEARRKENRHMSETHVDTRTQQNPNSNSALNPRGTTSRIPMHFPMLHPCCIHTRNQTTSVSFYTTLSAHHNHNHNHNHNQNTPSFLIALWAVGKSLFQLQLGSKIA